MTGLVLASASSGRLDVLRRAGVEPQVVVSGVDEDAVIAALPGAAPSEVVAALATAKARDVASGITSDCVVIGCDSMLLVDGQLRGKPGSVEAARSQWESMAGRSGQLLTGHCVIRIDGDNRREITETGSTTVHFGTPTAEDLEAYVAGGEPLWVAGGFTLDGLGGWFIDGIDGAPSNVIGLSLPLLRRMLTRVDISVARLWASNPPRDRSRRSHDR